MLEVLFLYSYLAYIHAWWVLSVSAVFNGWVLLCNKLTKGTWLGLPATATEEGDWDESPAPVNSGREKLRGTF